MYDREHTQGLVDEARRLAAALKVETREIGRVIERAFDDEDGEQETRNTEATEATPRKSRWWFWR
jgi:hypothetical protein